MSETVQESKSPEQRVFGDAFSLAHGQADEATKKAFFEERFGVLKETESGWLPRTLDADRGVAADLYKARAIAATLDFDYDTHLADVYVTSEGGTYGDTALCSQVPFDDAVVAAEQFAAEL